MHRSIFLSLFIIISRSIEIEAGRREYRPTYTKTTTYYNQSAHPIFDTVESQSHMTDSQEIEHSMVVTASVPPHYPNTHNVPKNQDIYNYKIVCVPWKYVVPHCIVHIIKKLW